MTPAEFVAKWRHVELTERASAQTHFLDLCRLVDHKDPVSADPLGQSFTFERGATKATGGEGWADVWKRGYFGFEYKGKHKDLAAAYWQLLMYQGALENPPLLVTCDTDRIVIHTHFANTPTTEIELTLEGLVEPEQIAVLRAVFHDPDRLRPDKTIQQITEEAAGLVTEIAQQLRQRGVPSDRVARFLDRVVFCLFAEDVGLLPAKVFTRVVENTQADPTRFKALAAELFECMANGGDFGAERIEHFNGNLFHATEALDVTADELQALHVVSLLDWSNIDPSIFGTLFERALDPDKRSQLGAHYTSREDIETLVDPVVIVPLRREWARTQAQFDQLIEDSKGSARRWREARALIRAFLDRLSAITVLDPACGSGNFLYVALQALKDLEKEVIVYASRYFSFFPQVGPWQLHGIEINRYAHELAQMTVWIGHLQWHNRHGMQLEERPILRAMSNFECRDAILNSDADPVTEPSWPAVDYIVSNPPFLGTKRLRGTLGDDYVEKLFALYGDRIPNFSDLVCYWFEKARAQVQAGKALRVGLIATQGIRGGLNREVLKRIKDSGEIFFAVSDRDWILDGAHVHVSMVGFDGGTEATRHLDGRSVPAINADLTTAADLTQAQELVANAGICYIADVKSGSFDIERDKALAWLQRPNPNGRPNSDVLRPWSNGADVLRRSSNRWIIDFPSSMDRVTASHYEIPFEHVNAHVRPDREKVKRKRYREFWWLHAEPCDEMRRAVKTLSRMIVTPAVAKHRIFAWVYPPLLPDHQLVVFASDDDLLFGVLHSRLHEVWTRRKGTQLREAQSGLRYTPTSTFATFPLPKGTIAQQEAVRAAAKDLDAARSAWLNPPEWTRECSVTFRASTDGPWAHLIATPDPDGFGVATYRWLAPKDDDAGVELRKRTLTGLYNDPPTWLRDAHARLDAAVFAAYGWSVSMTDDEVVSALLALNQDVENTA